MPAGFSPSTVQIIQIRREDKTMPGIKHSISIGAEPHLVYPLVATGQGFARRWASDVTEKKPGGIVELVFFKRATVYGLKPLQLVAPRQAHWRCQTGKEWAGMRLLFDLAPDCKNTLLRFTHADWQAETDYFVSCTTVWGELMFRIKAAAEGHTPGSLFVAAGLAY
jgi:hypothetical protein